MKQGICMRIKCTDCNKMIDIPKDKVDDYCIYHVLSDDIRKAMIPKVICPACLARVRVNRWVEELKKLNEEKFDFYILKSNFKPLDKPTSKRSPLSIEDISNTLQDKIKRIPVVDTGKYYLLHVTTCIAKQWIELVSDFELNPITGKMERDIINLFEVRAKANKERKVA